jgi:holo-[acyl-carrier protein] synthase
LRSQRLIAVGRTLQGRRRARCTAPDVAVGCDLVQLSEFRRRASPRFVARAFTPGEVRDTLDRGDALASLAARWAAKEAAYKALSQAAARRGLSARGLGVFRDYEVSSSGRRPSLVLHGRPAALAAELHASVALSLTHDGDYAAAFVVVAERA